LVATSKCHLNIHIDATRIQNPGFTTASYKVVDSHQQTLYQRCFKLGVTRNNESILTAVVTTLSDIVASQNYLLNNPLTIHINKTFIEESKKSLDWKIVQASQVLDKIQKKAFT